MGAAVNLGIIDRLETFAESYKTQLGLADVAAEAPVVVELARARLEALHGIDFLTAATACDSRTGGSILLGRHRHRKFLDVRFCSIVDGVGVGVGVGIGVVVVVVVIAGRLLIAFLNMNRSAERNDPSQGWRPLAILGQDLSRRHGRIRSVGSIGRPLQDGAEFLTNPLAVVRFRNLLLLAMDLDVVVTRHHG